MKNDGIQNSEVYENVLSAEKNADSPTGADSRVLSIDRMRGICIFIMVGSVLLSMFGDTFKAIAGLYGHGASGWQVVAGNAHFVNGGYSGIAFADVFAPLFIFVIGLTFCSSFKRREQMYGATRACFQLGVRFAALTGFGAVVDGVSCLPDIFGGKWSEMQFADKFFGVASFVLIAALLVLFVSQFVKTVVSARCAARCSDISRRLWAWRRCFSRCADWARKSDRPSARKFCTKRLNTALPGTLFKT